MSTRTVYIATGHLTGEIEEMNLGRANDYLIEHDMTQFIPACLEGLVMDINWSLTDNNSWRVRAVAVRELNNSELSLMADWVSGQNSDGLGEGFEQQPFAEISGDCGECRACQYSYGYCDDEQDGGMISFDWATREVEFKSEAQLKAQVA